MSTKPAQMSHLQTIGLRISSVIEDLTDFGPPRDRAAHLHTRWILGGVFLCCLIPRLVMAYLLNSACNDAYFYISLAQDIQQGQLNSALSQFDLNVYPFILAGLHAIGLEWVFAGKLWGAIIASLAVLPLYGFVRQLFDARIALAGCFVYAVHPGLIELSVEPIREPTFWFAFCSALYFAVRAVNNRRWTDFALFGMTSFLAIHTRSEGWLLLPAMMWWSASRLWTMPALRRRRLFVRLLLGIGVTAAVIVAVNFGLHQIGQNLEWGRKAHLIIVRRWFDSLVQTGHADGGARYTIVDPVAFLRTYFKHCYETIEVQFLVLLAIGFATGKRLLRHRDRAVLVMMIVAVMSLVMLYAWHGISRNNRLAINGRYFYTAFLIAIPFAGIGLLTVLRQLQQMISGWSLPSIRPRNCAAGLLGLLACIGCLDAWTSNYNGREEHVVLGRWLQANHGPFRQVLVSGRARRIGYYACDYVPPGTSSKKRMTRWIRSKQPDLVILSLRGLGPDQRQAFVNKMAHAGKQSPPLREIVTPLANDDTAILIRRLEATASRRNDRL